MKTYSNTTTCTINETFVMNAELYKGLQKLSLGYIARIIDGKLVRVARVTHTSVDYNYETNQ